MCMGEEMPDSSGVSVRTTLHLKGYSPRYWVDLTTYCETDKTRNVHFQKLRGV